MSVLFPGNSTPTQWVGPTGIAYHGNFYVSTLGQFPVAPGSQSIYKLNPGGQLKTAASGLTAVVAVAFDSEGRMYTLETDTVPGFPGPGAAGTGAIVRINGDGMQTTIATGLTFPTAMTFGPDGNLYVSNVGFGVPVPGAGEIVRIDMSSAQSALVPSADSGARDGPFTVPAGAPPLTTTAPAPVSKAEGALPAGPSVFAAIGAAPGARVGSNLSTRAAHSTRTVAIKYPVSSLANAQFSNRAHRRQAVNDRARDLPS
jgi:hypothetical protein